MATGESVINIAILGDARKFKKAIGEANTKLGAFGSRVGSISTSVAKGFGVMGAAAGGFAIVGGKHFFDVGQELVSLDQKINTVFSGQSLDQVTGWADDVAARMGLTSTQAAGLAANAGDLLKPMGFTADEAASMSTEIIGLSGALSEWSGGQRSVEETAEILSKALLGERDSLKSLGISINQAEVDQRAMTIAVEAGRDAITEQDKALATQQLVLEKSTDAQEAYAAGGNKLTAAQNRLKAAFGEIQERIARKLLPVFARLADIAVELIDVFDKDGLGGVISEVHLRIQRAWPAIKTQLGVWARGFVEWLEDVGPPLFTALGEFLLDFGNWFKDDALPVIGTKLGEWASAFVGWVADVTPGLLEKLGELLGDLGGWLIDTALPTIVEKLGEWGSAFAGWIADVTPPLLAELVNMLVDVGKWMIETGLPTLAELAARWTGALINWVIDVAPGVTRKLVDMLVEVGKWMIMTAHPTLIATAARWTKALVDWALDIAPELLKELKQLWMDVNTKLMEWSREFGPNIIRSIIDGIKNAPGSIPQAIFEAVSPSAGGIRNWISGKVQTPVGPIGLPGASGGPRAAGGPVLGNVPYLVGESGPEMFVPTGAGTIVNNARLGGMGGGGGMNITVNMPAGSNGDDVVKALQDYVRRRGAIPVPVGTARY
jgi:hypothetical protein